MKKNLAVRFCAGLVAAFALAMPVAGQETVCASVKIQIKQELTLERQAFDAEMKINNTTDSGLITNVSVDVKVMEENGAPVTVTDDPNASGAKFFIRVSNKQNISDVTGAGIVNPATSAIINWLLIPAPGSAGLNPAGKKYLVGATLKYRYAGEDQVLEVSPDVITVKPLPLLSLDYFLPRDVEGDDPLTAEIEPVVPFTLGVRVKNNGFAAARNLKIDSAQPKIVENDQGLLINFQLTGSYVDDTPTQNTLLLNFGDIAALSSRTGRWVMETSLSGKFTEFNASFSHADELGGAVTSILEATNAHVLIRDVRVDLPGRDTVRDFLAVDGDVIRIFESEGIDTIVTDRSDVAQLQAGTNAQGAATYKLTMPPTSGFVYAKMPDPFNGTKALGTVMRSDAKQMLPENVWLSRSRNPDTKRWEYFVNFFDVNTTGVYDSEFQAPPQAALPPVIQFIPDRVTKEGQAVSFIVEASSPQGTPVTFSAAPLPSGAVFTAQAADGKSPSVARASFSWTPGAGSAGNYLINYIATDGALSASQSASIQVEPAVSVVAPRVPTIDSPASGAQVDTLPPVLKVFPSTHANDSTSKLQFELYGDGAMTNLVATAMVNKAHPTSWMPAAYLSDDTRYWWRVRAFDGATSYSPWVYGRFFVNTYNDAPGSFNLTSPLGQVSTLTPTFSWTNSTGKEDDPVTYQVTVSTFPAMTLHAQSVEIPESPGGTTSWVLPEPLSDQTLYSWTVTAKDHLGATRRSTLSSFSVNTANQAPSVPKQLSPMSGAHVTAPTVTLSITNSVDPDGDLLTYVFEVDSVNTFDSSDKRSSNQLMQSSAGETSWVTPPLAEDKTYWWRVKAQDGRTESQWVVSSFLASSVNDAPPAPTIRNPGDGAWVDTRSPTLEANPVVDPEGDAVRYEFEVYLDKQLTRLMNSRSSDVPALITGLADNTTYWWRVRAVDVVGAASAWSAPAKVDVRAGAVPRPAIELTEPAVPVVPTTLVVDGSARKQVTLKWEGVNPAAEQSVALYYATTSSSEAGTLIVDGLRQSPGVSTGSYVWDVSKLGVGTYYLYALVYDAKGMGRADAPGAVVIPPAEQSGLILPSGPVGSVSANARLTYAVRLGQAPAAPVVVPVVSTDPGIGMAVPAQLVFTPTDWAVPQWVQVAAANDCVPTGAARFDVLHGKAISTDPNYIGVSSTAAVNYVANPAQPANTTNRTIGVCNVTIASEKMIAPGVWESTWHAELVNKGKSTISGVTAKVRSVDFAISQRVNDVMVFGAAGPGETVKTKDMIVLRTPNQLIPDQLALPAVSIEKSFFWDVTLQP